MCVCVCVYFDACRWAYIIELLALQCGSLMSLSSQVGVAVSPCAVSFDCRRSALLLSAYHLFRMFRATLALYSFAFAFAFACLLAYLLLITFVARWRETFFICLEIEPFFFRCLCLVSSRLVFFFFVFFFWLPPRITFYLRILCLSALLLRLPFCLLLFCELNIILIRMVHFPSTALQTQPKIDRFSLGSVQFWVSGKIDVPSHCAFNCYCCCCSCCCTEPLLSVAFDFLLLLLLLLLFLLQLTFVIFMRDSCHNSS